MSLMTYCMNILMSLMMLSMIFVMVTMSAASAERIAEVINEKSTLSNPKHPVKEVPDGRITFEHVDFSYSKPLSETGNGEGGELVLRDINLEIRTASSGSSEYSCNRSSDSSAALWSADCSQSFWPQAS